MGTKKKVTLYLSDEMIREAKREALRQDRSLSWILEVTWKIAAERLAELPGIDEQVDSVEEVA